MFSSDDEDDNQTTLGDAVFFARFKRKEQLEHAYAVTAWALSLHPEICADCAERMSTDKGDLRKLIDEVVAYLHTNPCPDKKVSTLSIDELIDIFGKSLIISLTALAHTAINLVGLKMMMPYLEDCTSGMKCICYPLQMCLVLSHVKQH